MLFIQPMRRHAVLRHVVHVGRAYLHLDLLIARLTQGHPGMQAPVAVRLRRGDVILKPSCDDRVGRMHRPKRDVASVP